jgi:hypothetical protein
VAPKPPLSSQPPKVWKRHNLIWTITIPWMT